MVLLQWNNTNLDFFLVIEKGAYDTTKTHPHTQTHKKRLGKKKMSLMHPPQFTSNDNQALNSSICCIWVSKSSLAPVAKTLAGLELDSSRLLEHGKIHCSTEATMKLIMSIQYQVYNAGFGKEIDLDSHEPEKLGGHSFFNEVTHDHTYSIDQYIEYIRDMDGELIGWRLWYDFQDPSYSLDRGFETVWTRVNEVQHKLLKRKRKRLEDIIPDHMVASLVRTGASSSKPRTHIEMPPSAPPIFEPAATKEEYIDNALSPYLDESFSTQLDRISALAVELHSPTNPAKSTQALTFEFTCAKILEAHPNVNPVYITRGGYFVVNQIPHNPPPPPHHHGDNPPDDDEEEEEELFHPNAAPPPPEDDIAPPMQIHVRHITFPHGAYTVPHEIRNPLNFLHIPLIPEPQPIHGMTEIQRRRFARESVTRISQPKIPGSSMLLAKATIAATIQGLDRHGIAEFTSSRAFSEMFESIIKNDDLNVGGNALYDWYSANRSRNENWSAVIVDKAMPCPTLSAFGNRIALEGILLECICSVSVLHAEALLVFMQTMSSGDIDKEKLRKNLIFTGPAGSGKSFLLELLKMLLPRKYINEIGYQTKRANTTDECFDGMISILDELNEQFTGKGDGSGISETKSMLSTGTINTQQPVLVDGHRKMQKTESHFRTRFIACTNLEPGKILEPIRDRFAVFYVPDQRRAGSSPIIESNLMLSDPESQRAIDMLSNRMTTRAFIAELYWRLNRTSPIIMPSTDTTLALQLISTIFDDMNATFGIDINKREQTRIIDNVIDVCIMDAISETFFTDKYLAAGTPFEFKQLFLLIPHLSAKREHVYYALTQLHQTIVDPSLPFIASALIKLAELRPISERYAKEAANGYSNFNYYFIPSSSGGNDYTTLEPIARSIRSQVKSTSGIGLGLGMVIDILRWMTTQNKEVNERVAGAHPNGFEITENRSIMPVASVRNVSTMRFGFEVLVGFLDDLVNKDGESPVITCVRRTIDERCLQKRFITGFSYRYGHPRAPKPYIFPQLFHIISRCAQAPKPLVVRNPKERPFLHAFFVHNIGEIDENYRENSYYQEVTEDIDQITIQKWWDKVGAPQVREGWQNTIRYSTNENCPYPLNIVKGELEKYGKDILPHDGNGQIYVGSEEHVAEHEIVFMNVHQEEEEEE